MILHDFKAGGFPITHRSPVLCTLSDGSVKVAYNRFDLKSIIMSGAISAGRTAPEVISCVGMWPGKKNTDCFILNPDAYKIAPPERYKDIDNAVEIKIYNDRGSFMKITYKISDKPLVESTDKELLKYIEAVGLKHQNLFAKGEL